MKIVTVVGARPQFIKAAVVSGAFVRYRPDLQKVLVHNGQHYDTNMSDVFFDELDRYLQEYAGKHTNSEKQLADDISGRRGSGREEN